MRGSNLGEQGEAAAERLLDAYRLATRFELCIVISEHGAARQEIKSRLIRRAPQLEELKLTDAAFADRVRDLPERFSKDDSRPVLWLDLDDSARADMDRCQEALAFLNRNREWCRTQLPVFWVLSGPASLADALGHVAPDLWSVRSQVLFFPEAPRVRRGGRVRWLHISDLHLRSGRSWDRNATLEAFLRAIRSERSERDFRPDVVFVTGDVAFSGQPEQYEQAELFLRRLAAELELEPRERFFVVPGNHDVDRSSMGPFDATILNALSTEQDVSKLLGDPPALRLIGARLSHYRAFTERLLGPARGLQPERLWHTDILDLDGLELGVLQLNSAWASGTERDQGNLLVGEAQLRAALAETEEAFLRVALVHHPAADLRSFDQDRLESLLAGPGGVAFLLRGHRHLTRAALRRSPDGSLVELAAGALNDEGDSPRGFMLGDADLDNAKGRVDFFSYSDQGRGFWCRDAGAYEQAPGGQWDFELPRHLRLDSENETAARGKSPAVVRSWMARYRTTAAAVHGAQRFVGLAARRDRPNLPMPALFVPLRFARRQGSADQKEVSTRDLANLLLSGNPSEPEAAPRIAILGDPGSGKTTLCRYLTVLLAGQTELIGAPVRPDVLPLFLPFRDYVHRLRTEPDLSLLEYLERQASAELSLTLPREFLPAMLEQGLAVLLLDGLDEVGNAVDRIAMRDRVQGFCASHPRVPVLVTSRVAGYDEAPLPSPEQGADAPLDGEPTNASASYCVFQHWVIAPFDDAELEGFVRRWYALQEPENARIRAERTGDLLSAMAAEPRVRELARNPLLATLIALIHRAEARLPGERATLYESCVQTLLVDWPAAKKRVFGEIDEGLQRRYLEGLALQMQRQRSQDSEVVIERSALEKALERLVARHHDPDRALVLSRRWIDYLEQHTGLVVEQRAGVFGFLHLALMEYLAACGLEHEHADHTGLVNDLLQHYVDPLWQDVCLLAVGRHATDAGFLDELLERLLRSSKRHPARLFLLLCLREEAAFEPAARETILDHAAEHVLDKSNDSTQQAQRACQQLLRFSQRHQQACQAWLTRRLAQAQGEALLGVVTLSWEARDTIIGELEKRPDAAEVAATLLEFWPGSVPGVWAARRVSLRAALRWVMEDPAEELLVLRGLAALETETPPLRGALAARLAVRTLWGAFLGQQASPAVANGELPARQSAAPAFRLQPFGDVLHSRPWTWEEAHIQSVPDRHRALDAEACFWRRVHFGGRFSDDFARDLAEAFARNVDSGFTRVFARDFASDVAADIALLVYRTHGLDDGGTLGFARMSMNGPETEISPVEMPSSPRKSTLFRLREPEDEQSKHDDMVRLRRVLTFEGLLAVAATAGQPKNRSRAYALHRLQNRFLLEAWPLLDVRARLCSPGAPPDPTRLALYLALGWSQATVTWTFPGTEPWCTLFEGPPPEHWLPRVFWELCFLIVDKHDPGHRAAFFAALDVGRRDADLSPVADELSELFGADAVGGDQGSP